METSSTFLLKSTSAAMEAAPFHNKHTLTQAFQSISRLRSERKGKAEK
jgi:hypothetical protein